MIRTGRDGLACPSAIRDTAVSAERPRPDPKNFGGKILF